MTVMQAIRRELNRALYAEYADETIDLDVVQDRVETLSRNLSHTTEWFDWEVALRLANLWMPTQHSQIWYNPIEFTSVSIVCCAIADAYRENN